MTEGPAEFEPSRIADEVGEAGGLLRRAEQAFLADLSESRAFRRLGVVVVAPQDSNLCRGGYAGHGGRRATAWFHQEAFRNTESAQAEPLPVVPSAFNREPEKPLAVPASVASTTASVSSTTRKEPRGRESPGDGSDTLACRVAASAAERGAGQKEYQERAFLRAADCFRSRTLGLASKQRSRSTGPPGSTPSRSAIGEKRSL